MDAVFGWRGDFASEETNSLHAAAFGTRVHDVSGWDWRSLVEKHSLGWGTAVAVTLQRAVGEVEPPVETVVAHEDRCLLLASQRRLPI